MTLPGSIWSTRTFRAGLTVLVIGWLPLLLYVAWAWVTGEDGNPIGLGLLMVFSTPVALVLVLVGLVQGVLRHTRRS